MNPSDAPASPDDWAQQLSAPAYESSDARIWPTAILRHWRGTSPHMDQPILDHHYIVQHLGGAKRVERRRDGETIRTVVECGSLTIVPAGTSYVWHTTGPIEFAHLYVSPTLLQEAASRIGATYDPSLIERVGVLDPMLQGVFSAMLAAIREPGEDQSIYLDGLFDTFLLRLLHDHSTARIRPPALRETLAPFKLKRVVEFVDTNLDSRMTLSSLAQIAQVSAFHFSRAFRNSVGETPYQYVVRRRVERAKHILSSSRQSIGDVAVACGFRDGRHLARTFKRLTGLTPVRFQQIRLE